MQVPLKKYGLVDGQTISVGAGEVTFPIAKLAPEGFVALGAKAEQL